MLRVGMTSPGKQFEAALSLASHPQPIQLIILITLISVPVYGLPQGRLQPRSQGGWAV